MLEALEVFWTEQTLVQTLIIICITCGAGLFLGKIKLGRFSLEGAGVFFFGIFMAHFGAEVHPSMLEFCQNFGLVLFVYALGIQVGPSFVASLKSHGIVLNAWSMGLILLGFLSAILFAVAGVDTIGNMMGVLSGAVTNTPSLAAAQQGIQIVMGDNPNTHTMLNDMALATAITYPIGVIGVIIVLELLKLIFPRKSKELEPHSSEEQHHVGEYIVVNEGIIGKSLREVQGVFSSDFLIARILRQGKVFQPLSDTILEKNDLLRVVSEESEVEHLTKLFGELSIETHDDKAWGEHATDLVQRRLLITKRNFNGASLASLRLRNEYGVTVTRINRAEIDLVPAPSLHLQIGDRLTVIGPQEGVERLSRKIGDQLKPLDSPYLISIFVGMALGLILGSIPIIIPGLSMPIKFGLAGGPIIVGILMGAYGPRMGMTTYITQSANLMLRTFGITLYLGCLGLSAGGKFVATLIEGSGLLWLLLGAGITIVPTLIISLLAMRYSKLSFGTIGGLVCGAMANPIALEYLNGQIEDDTPTVGYATVYPLGMFMRVVLAQITITLVMA